MKFKSQSLVVGSICNFAQHIQAGNERENCHYHILDSIPRLQLREIFEGFRIRIYYGEMCFENSLTKVLI